MIAEIAKGEYKDLALVSGESSSTWKISIRKSGFSGSVTDFKVHQPAVIEYFGNDEDAFDPVKSSRCSFALIGTTDAENELLQSIAQSEFKEYGVILYKGSDIVWRGWIYPEQSQKDLRYRAAWLFQAGDGLALLDFIPEPSEQTSIKGVIEQIFKDPSADSKDGLSFGQLYSTNEECLYMHLEWAYWRFSDEIPAKMYNYFFNSSNNFYELLSKILRLFAGRIQQSEGVYQITHLPSYIKRINVDRVIMIYDDSTETLAYPVSSEDTVDLGDDMVTVYKSDANFRYQPAQYNQEYLINIGNDQELFGFQTEIGWSNGAIFVNSVYSNNSSEFTIISGVYDFQYQKKYIVTTRRTSGTNNPTSSGTLTKVSGAGPATITFSAVIQDEDNWDEDFTKTVQNNSYYKGQPELLNLYSKQDFDVPKTITNFLFGGGLNAIQELVTEGNVTRDVYMTKSKLALIDIMEGGQDMTSGWSIETTNTTSTPTTLGRNVATSLTGTLTNIWRLITGLETSTNYVLIAESFLNDVANSTYESFISPSPTTGSYVDRGLYVYGGGVTAGVNFTTTCAYYFCQFNTGANTSIYMQLVSRLAVGDDFEWGNVRLFKASELNTALEDLMLDQRANHYAFSRRIYNLTARGQVPFYKTREYGNEVLLPASVIWDTKNGVQSGSWIAIQYNQAAKYDPSQFGVVWSVSNNGEPNNSLRHLSGAAGSQITVLDKIRQGGFRIKFRVFADSSWFAESSPRMDIGLYKEEDGAPSSAGPVKYGFRVNLTATSPNVTANILCYVDGLKVTEGRTLTAAPGGAKTDVMELYYDGQVLHFFYDNTLLYREVVSFQDTTETLQYVNNTVVVNALRRTLVLEELTLMAENLSNIQSFY